MTDGITADSHYKKESEFTMFHIIAAVLVVLWLLGFIGHIGGGLIHILLVVAAVVFLLNFINGRRTSV